MRLSSLFLIGAAASLLTSAADKPVTFEDYPFIESKGYVCYRAPSPITIDGKLDDEAWKAAPWTDAFIDIEGDKKPRPRHRTRVKMLWDDTYLYIAAELVEPHVWATLKQHDSVIFQDNDFEIFIDPDGDNHLYAELEINALNTTWDLLLTKPYKDGGRAINAWEIAGLKTAVHIDGTLNDPRDTDKGWSIEIAWPLKNLLELAPRPMPPKDGEQWRINFSCVEWQHEVIDGKYRKVKDKREDNWVWSPQGVINMHRPERWGVLQFSTEKPGTATFRPDPDRQAKYLLHRVYYAERDYRKARGVWGSLEELRLAELPEVKRGQLVLERTATTFEATLTVPQKENKTRRWHIAADSRIWSD